MIIIGHPAIAFRPFVKVENIKDIAGTQASQFLWFDAHLQTECFMLANHCQSHQLPYAVMIHSINELLIFNALEPKYFILHPHTLNDASSYQKLIEYYLLESKLLYPIDSQDELQKVAELGIDGVIFKQVLE